jgi:uncharacterized protein YciI
MFDRADRMPVREQYLQDHIQWLDDNRGKVLVAGALREAPETKPVGGLWIVEAESRADIESLIHTDPFWVNSLRERFEIYHWTKVFQDRKVPV